jgi:outer membrane receptor protein involved in Fe transport
VENIIRENPDRPFHLGAVSVNVTSAASTLGLSTDSISQAEISSQHATTVAKALEFLPGVSIQHIASNRNEAGIMVRGFSSRGQVPLYLDGIPIYVPYDGYVDFNRFLTSDIAEVQVSRGYTSPLLGPNALGGTINLVFKSGTKDFHGSLYENNLNNFLNAKRWENRTGSVPPVHVNEWGATFGGPVLLPKLYDGRKKQTFFFLSYDGMRNKTPGGVGYMSIPTIDERNGDFSKSWVMNNGVKYPVTIYDPSTIDANGSRTQFAGNKIANINPISAAILKLMPAPDNAGDGSCSSCNNYLIRALQNDKFVNLAMKFDQAWNNAHHSYVSLRYNNWSETSYDNFGPGNPLQGMDQFRKNQGMTIDHTWVISAVYVADFRYNITGWNGGGASNSAGYDISKLGFPSSFASLLAKSSIPKIYDIASNATNGGLGTDHDDYTQDTTHSLSANLTQIKGNHTFRYGLEFTVEQQGTGGLGNAGGYFNFGKDWTTMNPDKTAGPGEGSNLASFLLGLPTKGGIPTNATAFWSQHYTALYLQDDWRATDKLTVNLGLRWDYTTPTSERFNRGWWRYDSNVNLSSITDYAQPAYATLIAGTPTNAGAQFLQQYRPDKASFVARGGILYAGKDGTSTHMYDTHYRYFQPRIGFAYRLAPNTVIRGGAGRFVQSVFDTAWQDGFSQWTNMFPTNDNWRTASESFTNLFPNGKQMPIGNSKGIMTNPGTIGTYYDSNLGKVFVDEASLHVQHQVKDFLLEIGGTLNISHNLQVTYNVNNPSIAAWQAAYGPTFSTTGTPNGTKTGDVQVTNPFLPAAGAANYFNNYLGTNKTLSAYQLVRPNPLYGDQWEKRSDGKSTYYALQAKVERRLKNGFSLLQSFSWGKQISENAFLSTKTNSTDNGLNNMLAQARGLSRQLDGSDRRFLANTTSTYILPFGRGKLIGRNANGLVDRLIGGWEIAGVYSFASGTPVTLPTNNAFFNSSCDPSLGSGKTNQKWLNTDCFRAFPSKSTTYADLHDANKYPSWTGVQNLPGYNYQPTSADLAKGVKNGVYQDFTTWASYNPTIFGNIRSPYTSEVTLGIRKNIQITERTRFQLRMDAFNALNHPRFSGANTDASSSNFGVIGGSINRTEANSPRAIQISGKITF